MEQKNKVENFVRIVEEKFQTIPEGYSRFIGVTHDSEDVTRANANFPALWYSEMFGSPSDARAALGYFYRHGYKRSTFTDEVVTWSSNMVYVYTHYEKEVVDNSKRNFFIVVAVFVLIFGLTVLFASTCN